MLSRWLLSYFIELITNQKKVKTTNFPTIRFYRELVIAWVKTSESILMNSRGKASYLASATHTHVYIIQLYWVNTVFLSLLSLIPSQIKNLMNMKQWQVVIILSLEWARVRIFLLSHFLQTPLEVSYYKYLLTNSW